MYLISTHEALLVYLVHSKKKTTIAYDQNDAVYRT